ncbi:MAG: tRNA (adenosine(37)-N6)-threonylcarbamoyltransferase complex ATPase subunit type 1 TsaE [Aestuariibaculum sp.]
MSQKITYNLNEIEDVAQTLINKFDSKIILFEGDMGTGKTTLIKNIVTLLGSGDEVSSPTFSIVNEYYLINGKVYHFDLYRINDIDEILDFGIEDYLDSGNWVFIEWPNMVKPLLPSHYNILTVSIGTNNNRQLYFNNIP